MLIGEAEADEEACGVVFVKEIEEEESDVINILLNSVAHYKSEKDVIIRKYW